MGLSDIPEETRKFIEDVEKRKPDSRSARALEDIAQMIGGLVGLLGTQSRTNEDSTKKITDALADVKKSVVTLNDKETPEMPDYAQPVVEGLRKLESSLTEALNSIDIKPQFTPNIQVASPNVNVETPEVDLSGIEKVLKSDIPAAFKAAIKLIPESKEPDNSEVENLLQEMSQKLSSIDTASRMKPMFPTTLKVTNPDGSYVGGSSTPTSIFNGSVTVTTAGTRVQMPSTVAKSVTIKADIANVGIIYIGNVSVTAANGIELGPGDGISFDIANINTIYIDASANGLMVNYLGVA